MNIQQSIVLLAAIVSSIGLRAASAADDPPVEATVTVDAGQILRTMDPQRLGGTNVAMWYYPGTYDAPQVQQWMPELRARYIRMPGGSWANGIFWNGHGVRGADGKVDPSKVGSDGYPAVDYSDYAPSFRVSDKDLHPEAGDWHGHVDVKKQHEFIQAIPGSQAMACPNAGTGRAVDAAEWVKWANLKMGYDVRYWEIGNELGGSWEAGTALPFGKGQLTAEMYTKRYNDMASAMRAVDPTIKIGSCPFVEEALRDCGQNVDFVSIHTYPGSTTLSEAQMFADIARSVERETAPVKKWIRQYQPQRENQIEIAYSEWNLGGGVDNSRMFSGLWSSIFLGELARNGVAMANQWDCFSDLFFGSEDGYARKSEYYALWLWNNYMGDRLIQAASSNQTVYTYASRSDDAVSIMLINTDLEREANVNVQLAGFTPAAYGELVTLTRREYYLNPVTRRPLWSTGPRFQEVKTGAAFGVTLAPFSIVYVRIPDQDRPGLSPMAQKALALPPKAPGAAELRFVMPAEMYAGDQVRGELIALAAGLDQPYGGTLAPATLSASADVSFDRTEVRLAEAVGHFAFRPAAPGELTLTARSGEQQATHKLLVKPSIPRPVVFWDFSNPPVTNRDIFVSDFDLKEDWSERANRAVARVDLAVKSAMGDNGNGLLKVNHLPEADKLNKSNIRGVVVDAMTSADFECDDPGANVMVIMQSPANWWMRIGYMPLSDAKQWKTYQLEVKDEEYFKALPSALNIIFVLQANKPVKGSIYFDRIGLMVR
jgi:hypothetical protein